MPPGPSKRRLPIEAREQALLAAIRADPQARAPRTVYADFLQERGDPRGEYMALRLRWDALDNDGRGRANRLEKKHGGSWLGAARPFVRTKQYDFGGMLCGIRCEVDKLVAGFDAIVSLSPTLAIEVTSIRNRAVVKQLAELDLARVYELRIVGTQHVDDRALAVLAPALGRCKRFEIAGSFGPDGLRALEPHVSSSGVEHIQLGRWTNDTKTGLYDGPAFSEIPTIASKLSFEQPRGARAYRC